MAAAGLAADDVIAIGDDYNDLEMIRGAGPRHRHGQRPSTPSVTPPGTSTGSNDDDGVVQALERFVLHR